MSEEKKSTGANLQETDAVGGADHLGTEAVKEETGASESDENEGHSSKASQDGKGVESENGSAKLLAYIVDSYAGEKLNGLFHGKGKVVFTDGNVYEGDFQSGLMNGKGSFTWVDGTVYEGTIEQNNLTG